MTTAFQRDSYQNNAFQIEDTHDGADARTLDFWKKKRLKHPGTNKNYPLNEIKKNYAIAQAENLPALISVIDPYVPLETEEQITLRTQAKYVINEVPDINKINLEHMAQNQLALEKFLNIMDQINEQRKADDMLLIMLAALID